MRKEYDFSQGSRGKHAGKPVRVVGDIQSDKSPDTAARIQRTIERDLKAREDFKVIWSGLNQAERAKIRAAWLKKINTVLGAKLARPSR